MNVLNEEVRALRTMYNFYKMQLLSCESTQKQYIEDKIKQIEYELEQRLEKI